MAEERGPELRVLDMLKAISDVRSYLVGRTAADLDADSMFRRAVVQALTELGEAGKFVPEEYRRFHDLAAWRRMTGMRDWLVHGYFIVAQPVLWKTITEDLDPLEAALRRILAALRAVNN